ncbi:MAG: nucleotide exchange factor GrpE, partial [Planctomycetes bacterium]|nr:nucleotide exchange factor GrpE [Planctomycetota bacterium]
DNFERALESSQNSDVKSFKKGTKLIYQQLNELLKKEGVEPIKAVGEEFNPNLHEAMMQVQSDKYPEGVIVDEVARGYKVKDKVIRFSKVSVSKGKEDSKDKKEK